MSANAGLRKNDPVPSGCAANPAMRRCSSFIWNHQTSILAPCLADAGELPGEYATRYECYAGLLSSAYSDFVNSDARTEKVFRVFHMHESRKVVIPVESILGPGRDAG